MDSHFANPIHRPHSSLLFVRVLIIIVQPSPSFSQNVNLPIGQIDIDISITVLYNSTDSTIRFDRFDKTQKRSAIDLDLSDSRICTI